MVLSFSADTCAEAGCTVVTTKLVNISLGRQNAFLVGLTGVSGGS